MAMVQSFRFLVCVRKNALALVRKRQINRGRNLLTNGGSPFDLLANALDGRGIPEKSIGQILVFTDKSEQKVFGFDGRAAELTGLVTSKENDPTCSFRIS